MPDRTRSPFDDLTYKDFADRHAAAFPDDRKKAFDEAYAMAYTDEPDQWTCGGRPGDGFIGPKAGGSATGLSQTQGRVAETAASLITGRLQQAFTPEDVLQEVIGRRGDAVTAKPPSVRFQTRRDLEEDAPASGAPVGEAAESVTSESGEEIATVAPAPSEGLPGEVDPGEATAGEAARLAEMEALTDWADDHDLDGKLAKAVAALCCFQDVYLRPFVPAGRLVPVFQDAEGNTYLEAVSASAEVREVGSTLNVRTPADALRHIHVEVVLPDAAAVVEDPETRYAASVVLFGKEQARATTASGTGTGATGTLPGAAKRPRAEVSYTDESAVIESAFGAYPQTVLKVIEDGQTAEDVTGTRIALRGRTLLVPMHDHALFLDNVMRQLQKAVNTASTERRIVNDDAGFPVRLLMNALPPGAMKKKTNEAGQTYYEWEPMELTVTPGGVVNIAGQVIYDPTKQEVGRPPVPSGIASPSAQQWDAADSEHYAKEVQDRVESILRRARQLFVLITGDATASGVSRQQALQDFLQDAERLRRIVDRAMKILFEVVWDYACYLSGKPARDYDLEVVYESRITAPPRTPSEVASSVMLYKEGLTSRARTQQSVGVDEPEAEDDTIAKEQASREARIAEETERLLNPQPSGDGQRGNEPTLSVLPE